LLRRNYQILDLTWETTTQYNAGIDLGLDENRINLTADVYYKRRPTYSSAAPFDSMSSGYASASENIGSLENRGLEFTLNTENISNKDFSWRSTLSMQPISIKY